MMSDRLTELLEAIQEGRAGTAEFDELDRLLADNPEAQEDYLFQIDLHHSLKWQMAGEATYRSMSAIRARESLTLVPGWMKGLAAAAAILFAIMLATTGTPDRPSPAPQAPPVAVLMNADGAVWNGLQAAPGTALPAGRLELIRGRAEVEFIGGTRVLLQAPAEIEMTDATRAVLRRGSVTVGAPAGAGFELSARSIQVRSDGAEFGLRVGRDIGLSVFEGEVESRVESIAIGIPQTLMLTREESLHLDAAGTLTANIVGAPGPFARLDEHADPDLPRVANGSFEYPRTGSYAQLAAAGWRLQVHPLANLENMPVQTGAGVVDLPGAPDGRQWGFLNARTFEDGRTYHTSMHQAVGRLVPGATYRIIATVARPADGDTGSPAYTIGLYDGTRETGPSAILKTWNDPALPEPGRTATIRLTFRVPADHPEDRTLFLRIASIPGPRVGTRQVLLDDIRLERPR